ncbi:hypothetical protein ABZY45_07380 [Streptomyces sp. NPDC006516]|uniref:hypothetical protein n=1 Tax=Streptomyces sp. NPDC006516 TaxID=3154309 RepID=UPI0033B2B8B9
MGPGKRNGRSGAVRPDGTVAMVVCASQLGALLIGTTVIQLGRTDEYGRPAGSALGLLFVVVLAPPLLLVLGVAHTVLVTMPADLLAGAAARRAPGGQGEWQAVSALVLGVLYAIPVAAAGAPYLHAAGWIAGSAVLPLLGVALLRRAERRRGRPPGRGAVWLASLAAGLLLVVLSVVACALTLATGLVGDYTAPQLGEGQMHGVWRSEEDGLTEIRLAGDGRAELTGVPYESGFEEMSCDGGSSWTYRPGDGSAGGAVELAPVDPACPAMSWTVGGTEKRPELYVLFGAPDAGDVRVLVKEAP